MSLFKSLPLSMTAVTNSCRYPRNIPLDQERALSPKNKCTMTRVFLDKDIRLNTPDCYSGSILYYRLNEGATGAVGPAVITCGRLSPVLSIELELPVAAHDLFAAQYEKLGAVPLAGRTPMAHVSCRF
ncbi:MAG: hypothetical protein ACYC5N_03760 [Endomicrobiales bacterium]